MTHTEEAFVFDCAGASLVGILSKPAQGRAQPSAVLVVVGGPQYRAGSHRLFTQLARGLAEAGYATLRFDVRGMGDSAGEPRPFDALSPDIAAAMDALQARLPHIDDVVLWGLCDGASAALLYVDEVADARVSGLVLLNPWVRSAVSLARTQVQHYYRQRLMDPAFWGKLLRGGVGLAALREWHDKRQLARRGDAVDALPKASFQQRMARAWLHFDKPMLLQLAARDETAQEFLLHSGTDPAWRGAMERSALTCCTLPDADHTFSTPEHAQQVIAETMDWLRCRHGATAGLIGSTCTT